MHRLTRPARPAAAVSLVSMIDVLMIMLVFFMVTSTFLDLDMLPLAARGDAVAPATEGPARGALLVRIGADGSLRLGGQHLTPEALADALRARPGVVVTVLPSAQAPVQALASVMDAASSAGVARLDILQLEPAP